MKQAFFVLGLAIAIGACVLMLRQYFQLEPIGFEMQLRGVAMGFAFLGCAFARFAMIERA